MKILLHICCGNCSISPVKILRTEGHEFTGFWFNPNIHPAEEYYLRLDSLKKLAGDWNLDVSYIEEYTPEEYFRMYKDASPETPPSFPERCKSCYKLRLERTAQRAKEQGFDAFSTTLLISPYQDFDQIVAVGKELADKYNVLFHVNDYRPEFRNAMTLAKELGLYRQKFCGCVFSQEERNRKKKT